MNIETIYLLISVGMLALLSIALFRVLKKYEQLKYKYHRINELLDFSSVEKEMIIREQDTYHEYLNLFKSYCNEDWSRDTPFLEKIEALSYFWGLGSITEIYPLSTKIKDISITKEEVSKSLKEIFGKDWDRIEEMSLKQLICFSADLRSYRENYDNQAPEEYYQKRLNFFLPKS